MRVLVTGASGVVGRAIVPLLRKAKDIDVIAIEGRGDLDLECFSDTQAVFRFIKPDHVIHLAGAVFGVGGNLKFPADSFRRNIMINCNVIECCREYSVKKIVAMGTTAIYSDEAAMPFKETDALKGEPHGSEYAYASAKRSMLVQLESYKKQYGMHFVYAIATNMYGPHDRFDARYGHVIPSLVQKFDLASKSGEVVEIWGDGTPTRDFLFSSDAAHAIATLLGYGDGAYNLASGNVCSIAELVDVISGCFPSVKYKWDTSKPLGQLRRDYNTSRLAALGFKPAYDLKAGIKETVNWYLANTSERRTYSEITTPKTTN